MKIKRYIVDLVDDGSLAFQLAEKELFMNWNADEVEDEECEDCISREALLNSIEEPMNWTDSEAEIQEQKDYENFVALVKSMPSVTPKPKVGKWDISTTETLDGQGLFECTVCGHLVFTRIDNHYCSNCGAKMEDEE